MGDRQHVRFCTSSGAQDERLMQILGGMLNDAQMERVVTALTPIMADALAV